MGNHTLRQQASSWGSTQAVRSMTSHQAYQDSPGCFQGLGVSGFVFGCCTGVSSLPWSWSQPPPIDLHSSQRAEAAQHSLPFISISDAFSRKSGEGEGGALMFLRDRNYLDVLPGPLSSRQRIGQLVGRLAAGMCLINHSGELLCPYELKSLLLQSSGEDKNKEERSEGQARTTWDKGLKPYQTPFQKISFCFKSN